MSRNTAKIIYWVYALKRVYSNSAQAYLSDRGNISHARGVGGGVVGIAEGLLARVHGNLILPIEPMVTQLGHPFIKLLL